MRESVLREIEVCPACRASFIRRLGEVCQCHEEPVVNDWESHPFQPERRMNHESRAHADWHINLESEQ